MTRLLKLTEEQYKAAINEKFPDWEVSSLEFMGEGWESVAYRVNGVYIFRFPKREYVGKCLKLEIKLLPELAPMVDVAIPNFEFISTTPGTHFPYPFVGYKLLEGRSNEEWDDELFESEWWQNPVLDFIHTLHKFPLERARELGAQIMNPVAKATGTDMPEPKSWRHGLTQFYILMRDEAFPELTAQTKLRCSRHIEGFLKDDRNFEYEQVLLHADLSEDHILLDEANKKVAGIIDFGDVAIGDPAYDVFTVMLSKYKGNMGPNFKERRTLYGRVLAPFYAITYGQAYEDEELLNRGVNEVEDFYDEWQG